MKCLLNTHVSLLSRFALGSVLALALLAVIGAAPEPVQAISLQVDAPIDSDDGNIYWRWIGVANGNANCTLPAPLASQIGWSSRPLFPELMPTSSKLQTFCLFQFDGFLDIEQQSTQDSLHCLDALDGKVEHFPGWSSEYLCSGYFSDVEPDIAGVGHVDQVQALSTPVQGVPQSDTSQLDILADLASMQTGKTSLPTPLFPPPDDITLVLLDSSPTSDPQVGELPLGSENSPHGESLRVLVRDLLCDSVFPVPAGCLVEVKSRLALPYTAVKRWQSSAHHPAGGFVGAIGELGEAVVAEVLDWDGESPLILNLSLGWDRLYGGAWDPQFDGMGQAGQEYWVEDQHPAVQAVFRALEEAACRDVTVLAAAGNYRDAHSSHQAGPLMPAAWTARSASCIDSPKNVPLLHAVGGLDATRSPLGNALPEGIPELTAFADHVKVKLPTATPSATAPLTGSSVATAVVSASVAAAAYYADSSPLDMVSLIGFVRGAGDLVTYGSSGTADFCSALHSANCPAPRRISLCASAQIGCGLNGSCSAFGPNSCPAIADGLPNFAAPGTPPSEVGSESCGQSDCQNVCKSDNPFVNLYGVQPRNSLCPRRQHHSPSRAPGTRPQPEVGLCPTCWYDQTTGNFYGTVPSSASVASLTWPGVPAPLTKSVAKSAPDGSFSRLSHTYSNPTLHVVCNGVSFTYLHPGPGSGPSGGDISLRGLPSGCEQVSLSYDSYQGGVHTGSTTVPIQIANTPPPSNP